MDHHELEDALYLTGILYREDRSLEKALGTAKKPETFHEEEAFRNSSMIPLESKENS
jgi:hypothetical protein